MKRKNFTIRKPFSGGRSLYGPGLMGKSKSKRGTHQRRVRKMVSRYGGYMPEAEAKRLRKSARAGRPHKKQLEGLFHELYGRNPKMCGARTGREMCTRKPGHRGPHLPQGATMRTRARLRKGWQPKRENAGQGYGFTFSGAFKKKADAAAKESTRPGSFVKFVMTQQGGRYVVMTPLGQENPKPEKSFTARLKQVFPPSQYQIVRTKR